MHRDESGLNRSSGHVIPVSSDDSEEDEWVDEERPFFSTVILPGLLFLLTVCTVLWAGAYQTNTNPLVGPWNFLVNDPLAIWRGIPFAATLLGILVTHELGHYVLSRIHGVPTSLPLFVPGLPHFVGTFGVARHHAVRRERLLGHSARQHGNPHCGVARASEDVRRTGRAAVAGGRAYGNGRTPLMLAVRACVDSYWMERRSPYCVRALLDAGASASGVPYPSGYREVDALLEHPRPGH